MSFWTFHKKILTREKMLEEFSSCSSTWSSVRHRGSSTYLSPLDTQVVGGFRAHSLVVSYDSLNIQIEKERTLQLALSYS